MHTLILGITVKGLLGFGFVTDYDDAVMIDPLDTLCIAINDLRNAACHAFWDKQ